MRRIRYWVACKALPELAVYARPSVRLFARATLRTLYAEARYVDDETREVLRRLGA